MGEQGAATGSSRDSAGAVRGRTPEGRALGTGEGSEAAGHVARLTRDKTVAGAVRDGGESGVTGGGSG